MALPERNEKYVAYYRVSPGGRHKTAAKFYGKESQEAAVRDYAARTGGEILEEFYDYASGKNHMNRPQLNEALKRAKENKAIILVARLDRLARNVAFVTALMDTPGVEFRAADCPEANRMMIQIMAVFAEYERTKIQERILAGLDRAREAGKKLGRPENLDVQRGASIQRQRAIARAERLRPIIEPLVNNGYTAKEIVRSLNEAGLRTEGGFDWQEMSVYRVLRRLELKIKPRRFRNEKVSV